MVLFKSARKAIVVMEDLKDHWEKVYKTKDIDNVSWFQKEPTKSLEIIQSVHPNGDAHIIDIGSGASLLIDQLLENGYEKITALDISKAALNKIRERVGDSSINWVVANIINWCPSGSYDIWHDRAVFHFQTEAISRKKYIFCLNECLKKGGSAIIATFALDGPETCSGLPVMRYSAESLSKELGPNFKLVSSNDELHITPWKSSQKFQYSRFIRV